MCSSLIAILVTGSSFCFCRYDENNNNNKLLFLDKIFCCQFSPPLQSTELEESENSLQLHIAVVCGSYAENILTLL